MRERHRLQHGKKAELPRAITRKCIVFDLYLFVEFYFLCQPQFTMNATNPTGGGANAPYAALDCNRYHTRRARLDRHGQTQAKSTNALLPYPFQSVRIDAVGGARMQRQSSCLTRHNKTLNQARSGRRQPEIIIQVMERRIQYAPVGRDAGRTRCEHPYQAVLDAKHHI